MLQVQVVRSKLLYQPFGQVIDILGFIASILERPLETIGKLGLGVEVQFVRSLELIQPETQLAQEFTRLGGEFFLIFLRANGHSFQKEPCQFRTKLIGSLGVKPFKQHTYSDPYLDNPEQRQNPELIASIRVDTVCYLELLRNQ